MGFIYTDTYWSIHILSPVRNMYLPIQVVKLLTHIGLYRLIQYKIGHIQIFLLTKNCRFDGFCGLNLALGRFKKV